MKPWAESSETPATVKRLLLFIAISYLFAVSIRLIWVFHFSGHEQFYWNSQLMINTNDGYYFAELARDMLAGKEVHWSAHNGAVALPTVWLAQVMPVSFETILLYMPVFFGSLLVVPLVLIGQVLRQPVAGFIAALLGAVAWSYYNRTMAGYYDTDMLNIVLPMMVLWSLVFVIKEQKNRYLLLVVALLVLSEWWYPKNVALNTAMVLMVLIYSYVFDRKNLFNYKLLTFALVGLAFIPVYLKLLLAVLLFMLFHSRKEWDSKTVVPMLVVSIAIYLASGAFWTIWSSFNLYVVNRLFAAELPPLQFYDVINTVREASAISFETFADRISGSVVSFLFATVGVLLLIIRYPVMLISLPMVAMGFMAYKAGLRFTVYAVPVYALGAGILTVLIASLLKEYAPKPQAKKVGYGVIALITGALLYPNIKHVTEYKVPTVFYQNEVAQLDRLRNIASRDDYVVSWWDYGYPIRYYSDVNTLVDGGMHTGELNYPVSQALIGNQTLSANIARLDVEYAALGKQGLRHYLKDYGVYDPEDFLIMLDDKAFELPPKSRDIYYYLPIRMLDIFPTVARFSNIDLKTGQLKKQLMFYQTDRFRDLGDTLDLASGIVFDKRTSTVKLGGNDVPVRRFIDSHYVDGALKNAVQNLHAGAPLSIIFMRDYRRFLILDENYYNSTFIQLAVLEEYDPELFEPVVGNPMAKIYRLKR